MSGQDSSVSLKSVGATRKQIRHTVFYEALLLSAVGIPLGALVGCIGIGITLGYSVIPSRSWPLRAYRCGWKSPFPDFSSLPLSA